MATEETQVKQEKAQKKIVQITTSTTNTGQIIVTALCNDGTVWYKILTGNDEWKKVESL
jgi:hypothetical protein